MTSSFKAADLQRLVKSDLKPFLMEMGFEQYGKRLLFFKLYGEVYHVVSLYLSKWGGSFYVVVTAWVPELAYPDKVNQANLVEHVLSTEVGGRLSPMAVNYLDYSWALDAASVEDLIPESRRVRRAIDRVAVPWFASIATRGDLLRVSDGASLDPKMRAALLSPAKTRSDLGLPSTPKPYRLDREEIQPTKIDEYLAKVGSEFVMFLSTRGFRLECSGLPKFVRKREDIFDCVLPEIVSDGLFLVVRVFTWSPYLEDEPDSRASGNTLPERPLAFNGGFLGTEGIDSGDLSWLVGLKQGTGSAHREIEDAFDKWANPFFQGIRNINDLLSTIREEYRGSSVVERIRDRSSASA